MHATHQRLARRGASGLAPIIYLIIGVVMLIVGITIGRSLGMSKDSDEGNAVTDVSNASVSADNSSEMTAAQAAVKEDTDYDEAAEEQARRDAKQQPKPVHNSGLPPIAFEPPMLDFGIVSPGRLVTGTILIRNISTEPLFIETSKASCSCTAVDMSNTWIQPGEAVPMEATFTKQALGTKKAAVRFKFRGYNEIASVDIQATVALPVMASPAYVYAEFDGDTRKTLVSSGQFTVRSLDKKPFRILAVDGRKPNIINFNPATDAPRDVYEVAWDLSDVDDAVCRRADGSKLRRFWVIETDHPDCPVFDIQVRHMCTLPAKLGNRRWVITPQRVLLGELKPGESVDIDVLMKWLPNSSQSEEVYTVLTESPMIDVEVLSFKKARGNGREDTVKLRVTLSEDYPEGMIYENTRVHTRANSGPLVLIGRVAR